MGLQRCNCSNMPDSKPSEGSVALMWGFPGAGPAARLAARSTASRPPSDGRGRVERPTGDMPMNARRSSESAEVATSSRASGRATSGGDGRPRRGSPTRPHVDETAAEGATVTCVGSPLGPPQAEVRAAIASLIAAQNESAAEIAGELALGVHPWPDAPLMPAAVEAITEQLSPWLNCSHPDVREVVADRLNRLTEVFEEHNLGGAASEVLVCASERLVAASSQRAQMEPVDLPVAVLDPLGLQVGRPGVDVTLRTHSALPTAGPINVAAASAMLAASLRTGSLDLGVNFGGEAVGADFGAIAGITGVPAALAPMDAWISQLERRSKALLTRRVFNIGRSPTLQELGDTWGLSRERIRQLEAKVQEAFNDRWSGLLVELSPILASPRQLILAKGQMVEQFLAIFASSLTHGATVSAALVEFAGPWVDLEGWTHHTDVQQEVADSLAALRKSTDEYGLLGPHCSFPLTERFVSPDEEIAFLAEAVGLVRLSGQWSLRDSQRSRIAAALISIGRSATKAEIGERAGIPDLGTIGSNLSVLPGIVRADKKRWGLSAWIEDVYDGIVGEIDQRIVANHGSVATATLLTDLPRQFGVSEASVNAYLQTPAFIVERGFVRRAPVGAYDPGRPARWSDAECFDQLWGQRLLVDSRHLNGYSLKVRFDIAYANGIRPGDDLRVKTPDGHELSVIWRPHDATRCVDVGRVAELLGDRGIEPGQTIVVYPSRETVMITTGIPTPIAPQGSAALVRSDPLLDLLVEE